MKFRNFAILAALFLSTATSLLPAAFAQSGPAAVQRLDLNAFGAGTGTMTGLSGGKNLGITAGADLGIRSFSWFRPSIEVRATYPFDKGGIVGSKNILGGVKLEKQYHRYHPYVDALFGRAELDYSNAGYLNTLGTFRYTKNPSNVPAVGGGVDIDLTYHFALKADAQFERYSTPVTTSGHIYAKPYTLGVVYRFNFTHVYVPQP